MIKRKSRNIKKRSKYKRSMKRSKYKRSMKRSIKKSLKANLKRRKSIKKVRYRYHDSTNLIQDISNLRRRWNEDNEKLKAAGAKLKFHEFKLPKSITNVFRRVNRAVSPTINYFVNTSNKDYAKTELEKIASKYFNSYKFILPNNPLYSYDKLVDQIIKRKYPAPMTTSEESKFMTLLSQTGDRDISNKYYEFIKSANKLAKWIDDYNYEKKKQFDKKNKRIEVITTSIPIAGKQFDKKNKRIEVITTSNPIAGKQFGIV
jgi:hypothetical protein